MLLFAYGFLVGVIAWAFGRRGGPWILRLSEPGQQRVRLAAGMLATAVGVIGIAVLSLQLGGGDHAHALGWTIGAAVAWEAPCTPPASWHGEEARRLAYASSAGS